MSMCVLYIFALKKKETALTILVIRQLLYFAAIGEFVLRNGL